MNYREMTIKLENLRKLANEVQAQIGYANLNTEKSWNLIYGIVELRDAAARKAGIKDLRTLS